MAAPTDAKISKWASSYEKELCAKHNLIADRVSIAVSTGYSEYELPNYVTNIRLVLYKGCGLWPKGFTDARLQGNTPFSTEGSTPYEYMTSGKGLRTIKLYPTPMEDVAEYSGDLWTTAADTAAFIIEFYRTAEIGTDFLQMPDWMRRYIIKDYICWKTFAAEGPQQDLRAAKYYSGRLIQQKMYLDQIRTNLHMANQYVLSDSPTSTRRMPARPVLPPNFGTRVRW